MGGRGKTFAVDKSCKWIFPLDMSDPGLRNIVEDYLSKQPKSEKLLLGELDGFVVSGSIDGSLLRFNEVERKNVVEKGINEPEAMKCGNEKGDAERATLIDPSDSEFQGMMIEYLNKKKRTGQGPLDFRVEITTRWEQFDQKAAVGLSVQNESSKAD